MTRTINFKGHGANVVGSLGSGSLVQDMPSAMEFNGTTTHASSSATYTGLDATDNFTVAWWMKRGSNQNARIINVDSAASELFYARIDGTGDASDLEVFVDAATDGYVGAGTAGDFASDGTEWQHYTVVYDTATLKLYRNGVNIVNDSTINGNTANSNGPLYIGSYHSGGTPRNPHFDGSLRDMRIFTSGLTATQVTSVFEDTNMNGIGVTPVNWYFMEEGTGDTLNDSGSANIDLGIVSGSWDASMYNLNQIGSGSVSGSATVSGGTWNLKNSTYIRPTGTNNTNANYVEFNNDQQYDGSRSYAMWFYLSDKTSTQVMLSNYNSSNEGTQVFLNGGTTNLYLRLNNVNVNYTTATENAWNHLVWTIDETNNLAKGYLNGIEVTSSANDRTYGTVENMRLGADVKAEYPVNDGNYFSEYAYYTSVLTPEQIDLLYKGQWIGVPDTWIKLDEGTGTSVTNYGTDGATATLTGSGSTTPAWVKPDYNVNDGITTISGSVLSAPQGVLSMGGANWGPATFIHNSGTVTPTNAGVVEWEFSSDHAGSDNALYNLATNAVGQMRYTNGYIVENIHSNSGGNGLNYLNAGRTYNYGTTSSAASSSALLRTLGTATNYANIYGVSKLHPLILTSWDDTPLYTEVALKNVKVTSDIETNKFAGANRKVRLDGDCEFEKVIVDSGETLDLNGQRAVFNGNLDMESGVTFVGSGALLICNDKIKTDGATVYNSGTSVICGHAGTSTIRFNSGDWENLMYNPTGGGVCFDTNANVANNLIVAGGYYDMQTAHLSGGGVGKLQIATGGEFRGGDSTNHLITDTFNQRGGFIGKGAYSGDGANDNFMQIWNGDISDFEFGTGPLTIEAWVKASAAGGLIGSYWGSDAPMYQLDIGSGTATNMRVLATGAGGLSLDGLTQVDAPATTNVIDGKWHHVVGVRDTSAGLVKLYIDGKLENESSDAATVAEGGNTNNGQRKMVGSRGYYSELDGEIARASYWKVALTEAEIRGMMFQDWATMAAANVIDDSKCVGWYEFSDDQDATSVTDMTGSGNTGTLSSTDLWAAAGTFTYETCTLEFDNNGGTCNLYGPVSGPTPAVSGLTITNGTTMAIDCDSRDFFCYGLLVNSGTTTSSHNFQYRNRSMPIVGASSDLTFGTKIFYQASDGSANFVTSGAGTNYHQYRPSTKVWMQGDFDCSNDLLQSGGDLHLNGYKCSTSEIHNYGGGNIWAEPGSSIEFDTTGGFNKMYGASPTTMTFVASGENALLPNGNTPSRGNYFYTDAGPSTADGGAFGDSGSRKMSISMWFKTRKDANDADFGNSECVYGGNRGSSGEGSPQFTNYNATTLECRMHTSDPGGGGLGRAADVSIGSLSANTWYHLLFTSEETGGNVVQNMYIHNADGTIFNTDTATGSGKTWYISSSYPAWWIWGKDNRGTGNSYYMGHGMAMADVRLYDAILTSGNSDTLSTECPNISPSYADPANALGAITQWKLGPIVAPYQTSSYTDSVGSVTLTPTGNAYGDSNYKQPKSGFVIINGTSTPYNPINNIYPAGVTLINTYMSGSKDIIVGQTNESSAGKTAHTAQFVKTKGTVVLE